MFKFYLNLKNGIGKSHAKNVLFEIENEKKV